MDKHTIITLKLKGKSNREVARQTGFDRKTVARYWNKYTQSLADLEGGVATREAQEQITSAPKYDSSNRQPVKYTPEIDRAIDGILADEEIKRTKLGKSNKQMKTHRAIHKELKLAGFDIGLTTVSVKVSEKRKRAQEAFIAQDYDFGERLEYDFGEVRLEIGGQGRHLLPGCIRSSRLEVSVGVSVPQPKKGSVPRFSCSIL